MTMKTSINGTTMPARTTFKKLSLLFFFFISLILIRGDVITFANFTVVCRERRMISILLEPHTIQSCSLTSKSGLSKATVIGVLMPFFQSLKERKDTFDHQDTLPSPTDSQVELNVPFQVTPPSPTNI